MDCTQNESGWRYLSARLGWFMAFGMFCGSASGQTPAIEFEGTVKQVNASAIESVKASPNTVVVTVDRVIGKSPIAPGDVVTVQVLNPAELAVGTKKMFHTTSWVYGKTLALKETPTVAPSQSDANADLLSRVTTADMVLTGRISQLRAGPTTKPTRVSEHDPTTWREAVVRVTSGLKGAASIQTVVVRIPQSKDVQWRDLQKLAVGQTFTMLLHKDTVTGSPRATLGATTVQAYTILNPHDVLPADKAQQVRAMIR